MDEMNFEEAMQKLETITSDLEKGDLSLEDSVVKFEEGMKLSKKCNEIIEKAEKKITILLQKEENFQATE